MKASLSWIFSPLIEQSDKTKAKILLEADEWFNLILLMQKENLSEKFNAISVVEKIDSTFQKLRSSDGEMISIDLDGIDKIIKKQHRQFSSAEINKEYLSELKNIS